MISKYDVRKIIENSEEYTINKSNDMIIKKSNMLPIMTLDELVESHRKRHHCDFECIYDEHATLQVVYRCKDCGTVIFASDSEGEYDPNLCCPTCGGYHTYYDYWTQEDIDNDIKKQNTLKFFKDEMEIKRKENERYSKTGLYFNEIWKKEFNKYIVTLECYNVFRSKFDGLKLEIKHFNDDYVRDKTITIPLSWSALKTAYHMHQYNKKKGK